MTINYNDFGEITPKDIYLCPPNRHRICCLNGIKENTVSITENLKDYDTLSFDLDKYITDASGMRCLSNGYESVDYLMEIDVDGIGRYVVSEPPSVSSDGYTETKTIHCSSLEWRLQGIHITKLLVNTGEKLSLERLVKDNMDALGRTIEYITVYNPDNPNLSLLDIVFAHYAKDWSIGFISPLIAAKTPCFNIDSTNVYAFLTQDLAKYLQCFVKFDTIHKTISLLSADDESLDTNVYISFGNLAKSIKIDTQTEQIYTRYMINGGNNLDITQVNFGDNKIECLDYYLTENYLPKSTIDKYNAWRDYQDGRRMDYVAAIKEYILAQEAKTELINRVPIDALNIDFNTFSLEELLSELEYFEGLVSCMEQDFTIDGVLNSEALKVSPYWHDYHAYTTWIIPNIITAISNYDKLPEDREDYLTSWETEWELYGTDELKAKMSLYEEKLNLLKDYSKDWSELTAEEKASHSGEDSYNLKHDAYQSAQTDYNGAKSKYDELMAQINQYQFQMDNCSSNLKAIADDVAIRNERFSFSDSELSMLQTLYLDAEYTNEFFTTNHYTSQAEKVEEELLLFHYAKEDLAKQSRPQYNFSAEINNLYALPEFKCWHDKVECGNYIRLELGDGQIEKMRLSSKTYNPCCKDDDKLSVTFTSMVQWWNKKGDFESLFDTANSSEKNSISRGSNENSKDSTELGNDLIRYILNSRQMSDKLDSVHTQSIVSNEASIKAALIGYAKLNQLHSQVADFITANADTLFADYALMDYVAANFLQTNRTSTDFVTIGTDKNGNQIQINNTTMQFIDRDGNVFIQLGLDAKGNKSFILTDENGTTIIDSDGIKEHAISDGLIVNSMLCVKNETYMGIGADKLNIDSVVTGINNGNLTINAAKVYFDDEEKSLNTIMKEMSTSMTSVNGKLLYDVVITSSKGTLIDEDTILTANIYYYGTTTPASGSFSYTWYKNGVLIDGAVSAVYTVDIDDIENGAEFICKINYT